MSADDHDSPMGRWVIFLVATIITAFLIEYVFGQGVFGFALVMGVATGLAADVADAIVRA